MKSFSKKIYQKVGGEKKALLSSTNHTHSYVANRSQQNCYASTNEIYRPIPELDETPMTKVLSESLPILPVTSNPPRASSLSEFHFDKLPFQFYSRNADGWKFAYFQASQFAHSIHSVSVHMFPNSYVCYLDTHEIQRAYK